MKKLFGKVSSILGPRTPALQIRVKQGHQVTTIPCNAGQNLMDITNKLVNADVNIYGLCDKQLSCTTCSVEIESHFNQLKPPTDEQMDIITQVKNSTQKTRMACQIFMSKELNNLTIKIPYKRQPKKGARKFLGQQ